jgi:hypothetical protein
MAAESDIFPMQSLYEFCRSSEELVRAFWLATLCREAISQAATEKEEKTYGKISSEESGRLVLIILFIVRHTHFGC